MPAAAKAYDVEHLQRLEGLEPVRKRPAMYIGDTDKKGLHHLVWEIVDNSVDEYLNGHADTITVTLHKGGDSVTIRDNGRGIPVAKHPKYKIPGLELVLTSLHSGGKFGGDDSGYFHSGGLHGVGSSVVNALSKKLIATIHRDGHEWTQTFKRGHKATELEKTKPTRLHGTTIYFEPDPDIFRLTHFDADWVKQHLEDMAYIHRGLSITLVNEVTGETHDLAHPGGIPEFLTRLVTDTQKPVIHDSAFTLLKDDKEKMECALQWTESTEESFRSYVNGIRTAAGGTHENGFKGGIVKAIKNFIETHGYAKGVQLTADDIREGVVGILSVFVREPQFQGQTKEKLNNVEMTAAVDNFVRPALEGWLNSNMTSAEAIVGRIVLAARARLASREAAQEIKRKSPTQRRLNLPGKLADCKATDLDETELFIVEGVSAGGSAKQGRNNRTQAVLPLRGKILNSEGLGTAKVLGNQELNDLVTAIGTGCGESFNINGLRYGKIILLMDADADGYHITTLLMTFFFRQMTELIRKSHLFIAQPPLFRIDVGKETYWAKDERHREEILAGLKANAKPEITRFKGLGEMLANQLGETTLDPKKRTLLQVTIDSALEADKTFVELLGKDPAARHKFITESANQVVTEDLDV